MRLLPTLVFLAMSHVPSPAHESLVYVGTYTQTSSKGIQVARFDSATGRLGEFTLAAEAVNPSFLAISPNRRHLYAVSESAGASFNGRPTGTVSAYSLDPITGALGLINTTPSAGPGPCYLSVTPNGSHVLVANYGGGTVALLPVRADGGLDGPSYVDQHEGASIHPTRQTAPHAHSINPSPDGRFAFAANLGTDRLYTYRIDATKHILVPAHPASISVEPGAGPRHLAFAPGGRFAYVINELANTLGVFAVDPADGSIKSVQTVPLLPSGFAGESTAAEVAVHPSGRFVYGSSRGHDSIAVFQVDPANHLLSLVEHVSAGGRNPRHFAVDPTGRWLIVANQKSDSLIVFAIDAENGRLKPTGQTVSIAMPVCVRFH